MIPLWVKAAVALAVVGGAGALIYGKGHSDAATACAARWEARNAAEADAAAKASAKYLADLQAVNERNQDIRSTLNDRETELAGVTRDRDLARRLLAKAATAPRGGAVPQAGSGPGTPAAGGASSDGRLAGLLGDALDECRRNARRLDATAAELIPQL